MPNSLFGDFNPYSDLIHGDWFDPKGGRITRARSTSNGQWLIEAAKLDEVLAPVSERPAWLHARRRGLPAQRRLAAAER